MSKRDASEMAASQPDACAETPPTKKVKVGEDTEKKPRTRTARLDQNGEPIKFARYKKQKVAMLLAYCGLNYQGMQINPGCHSIEELLKDALVKAEAIHELNAEKLQKVGWQRCARTDKGVHAMGQIVSFKMQLKDEETLLERINANLPEDIRVFDYAKVTGSFNAKNMCSYREYEYFLPTASFNPDGADDWTFTSEVLADVNERLQQYVGTHNFHNFTRGVSPHADSSKRYIMEVSCSEPLTIEGVQYVRFFIKGQSFMMHQIRKMIAMVVMTIRDNAPADAISLSMYPNKLRLPLVPGMNLCLRRCDYSVYEEGRGKDAPNLHFESSREAVEEFTKKYIIGALAREEKKHNVTREWILQQKEYPIDYEELVREGTVEKEKADRKAAEKEAKRAAFAKAAEEAEEAQPQ